MREFFSSYKRLEKLCNDIYGENHGISIYIDEMTDTPSGARVVRGWYDDLGKLKQYRWIRNQIVHNPEYTEDDLCEMQDAEWLEEFSLRIINQKDPLAMYRQATKLKHHTQPAMKVYQKQQICSKKEYQPKEKSGVPIALTAFVIIVIVSMIMLFKFQG